MQDRKDLKIQALLEKITMLTTQYENQCADYRVEVTLLNDELVALRGEVERLSGPDTSEVPQEENVPQEDPADDAD